MDVLEPVRAALQGDDVDAMEDALLALWRIGYDPVVADLLVEFERDLDSRRPEPSLDGWWEIWRRRTAAKLRWARKGGSGDEIAFRIRLISESQSPDPRLTRFAVDLLQNSPSSRNLALDTALWTILERTRDPAVIDAVKNLPERSLWVRDYDEEGHPLVKCVFAPRFNKRLAKFPEQSKGWTSTPLDPEAQQELTSLVRTKMAELGKPVIPVGDALLPYFEAILETPKDDAPRHVFADRCLEEGDPERGEFITLQLMDPARRTPEGDTRMNAILAKRQSEWMGQAGKVTTKRSWEFKRGFPHAAAIERASAQALSMSRGAIGWRTMRELTVATKHENWVLLLEKRSLGALTVLRGDLRQWLPLVGLQWGHRLLELDLVPNAPTGAPLRSPTDLHFPALRRLRVTPRDMELAEALSPRRPLKLLHLTNASVGSRALARRFLLHPSEALEWMKNQRERVGGRIELKFIEGETTLLEVHSKRSGDRWVYAVAASDDLEGLEGVLESLEPDIVARRAL